MGRRSCQKGFWYISHFALHACDTCVSFQGPSGADKRMRTTSSGPTGGNRASSDDDGSSEGDRGIVVPRKKVISFCLSLYISFLDFLHIFLPWTYYHKMIKFFMITDMCGCFPATNFETQLPYFIWCQFSQYIRRDGEKVWKARYRHSYHCSCRL